MRSKMKKTKKVKKTPKSKLLEDLLRVHVKIAKELAAIRKMKHEQMYIRGNTGGR